MSRPRLSQKNPKVSLKKSSIFREKTEDLTKNFKENLSRNPSKNIGFQSGLTVYQANEVSEAIFQQEFGEIELKVFCIISMYVNRKECVISPDFLHIEIERERFCELLQCGQSNFYKHLNKLSKDLFRKTVRVKYKHRGYVEHALVHKVGYLDEKVMIRLDILLLPYLMSLKSNFTSFQLKNIINMQSSYAIKTYQLLKQHSSIGYRDFTIVNLRKYLGICDEKYQAISDFRVKVLESAKKHINIHTDLEVDFKFYKENRKISGVIFTILSKSSVDKAEKTTQVTKNKRKEIANSLETLFKNRISF